MLISRQITIISKPVLKGFWGVPALKPPFQAILAEVALICPVLLNSKELCIPFGFLSAILPSNYRPSKILDGFFGSSEKQMSNEKRAPGC